MKLPPGSVLTSARKAGVIAVSVVVLMLGFLVLRTLFASSSAEASSNVYNPSFCLGGWENPDAAAGKEGASAADGGSAAAYLAPDVFAQLFCGYFPVTPREKPPKGATVTFAFSLSGEAEELETPTEEETPAEEDDEDEPVDDTPPAEEETPADDTLEDPEGEEEVPAEEPTEEPSEEPADESQEEAGDEESEPVSFLRLFTARAHAQEASENLLVASYSFDGVRWYAAGRVSRENADRFSMRVPATMWSDLQNLQIMLAPLPISGERPDIHLESIALTVEEDLTIAEMATDGALAVGDVIGEVLGVADDLQLAAVTFVAPKIQAPPAPPAKVKVLTFGVAGNAVAVEGSGKTPPVVDITGDGLHMRVKGICDEPYYVILTYRSFEDFSREPRSFVSNYAGECRGGDFLNGMHHLPVDTPPGVYYLVVAEQGEEGSWKPVTSLLPIEIGSANIVPDAESP